MRPSADSRARSGASTDTLALVLARAKRHVEGADTETSVRPSPDTGTTALSPSFPGGAAQDSGPVRPDERAGFAAVALTAAAIGGLAFAVPAGHLRLVLLLVFLVFGPGSAVVSIPRIGDRLVSWSLAICAGISIACAAAVLTLWTHVWHPAATLAGLAVTTGLVGAIRLIRLRRTATPDASTLVSSLLGRGMWDRRLGPATSWRERVRLIAAPAAMLTAVGLWILSLTRATPSSAGPYGLSMALGVPFLAAVLLLGSALASELFGRARAAVLGAGILAVTAFMQASVPLLDGTIEYAWTYKHIGVVDLIRDNGHLLNSDDIYQQWPGFFATVAMISHVARVDALSFAAWSSPAFALLNALLVTALLRQFTSDRRIIALGVLLFQGGMWVDIGYFSPQAFVFPLMLGFWLIVVRWLLRPAPVIDLSRPRRISLGRLRNAPVIEPSRPRRISLGRLRNACTRGLVAGPEPTSAGRWWAVAGASALFATITASHQLSPFMIMLPLVPLAMLGVLRPRVLVLILGVMLAAFTAPRLGSVTHQYNLFDLNLLSNAAGNTATWGTPAQEFSALVARSLAIGLWGAAAVTIWRARRRLGTVVVPVVLAFAPFATLAGGNYGGEAIYRVFAFSLPFVALLIATWWAPVTWRTAVTKLGSGIALTVVVLAGLQGLQGQLIVHQVRAGDITAATYFYAHAVPGSSLVLAAPNFPTKLAANYHRFNEGRTAVDISLIGEPEFVGTMNGTRLADIETYVRDLRTPTSYLVVSTAMSDYTDYFGTLPKGSLVSLRAALDNSANWQFFYRTPDVAIYQLVAAPS